MDNVIDTSGRVNITRDPAQGFIRWTDLDPFTQGYIEALFASIERTTANLIWDANFNARAPAFRDLAPETMKRILEDCAEERREGLHGDERGEGGAFWRLRNISNFRHWPPLTPYLGDDGPIYLREGGQ